jgi:sugar/nucleoside kinase (ribokinase family)
VGSIALDSVYTPFGEAEDALGGSAVYFTTVASLYDGVNVVGVVGEDFPEEHLEFLRSRAADLRSLRVVPGRTFRWGGRYALDMNSRETLFTDLGVFAEFQPSVPPEFGRSEVIFVGNIHPQLQLQVLEEAEAAGGATRQLRALDTMNLWIDTTRDALTEVLRRVDVVLLAEEEVRQFAGTPSLRAAARQILDLGPKLLAIKQGSYGALLLGRDGSYFAAPSYPLDDVVDPTGAGDAFAGGFLGYLAARLRSGAELTAPDYRRALVHGNIMGSFACEDFSVKRLSTVTLADVEERYKRLVRFTHFDSAWQGEGDLRPSARAYGSGRSD